MPLWNAECLQMQASCYHLPSGFFPPFSSCGIAFVAKGINMVVVKEEAKIADLAQVSLKAENHYNDSSWLFK